MEHVDKINELADMFVEREKIYIESTLRILELVKGTVLQALYEIFRTDKDDSTLIEVELVGSILALSMAISYDDQESIPEIVQTLSPFTTKTNTDKFIKLMRVGVPIDLVFDDKEKIIEFLNKTVEDALVAAGVKAEEQPPKDEKDIKTDEKVEVSPPHVQQGFDATKLTEEQIQRLSLFQRTGRRTVH